MMKQLRVLVTAALLVVSQGAMTAEVTIEQVIEGGGQGYFNCAYKRTVASRKCHVSHTEEVVTDRMMAVLHGGGDDGRVPALSIAWPDKTRSVILSGDSREICNLKSKSHCEQGHSYKFGEWPEIDYSNGLIILDKDSKEYIRLW